MAILLIGLAVLVFMGIPALIFIAACIAGARASQQQEALFAQFDVTPPQETVPDWSIYKEKVEA